MSYLVMSCHVWSYEIHDRRSQQTHTLGYVFIGYYEEEEQVINFNKRHRIRDDTLRLGWRRGSESGGMEIKSNQMALLRCRIVATNQILCGLVVHSPVIRFVVGDFARKCICKWCCVSVLLLLLVMNVHNWRSVTTLDGTTISLKTFRIFLGTCRIITAPSIRPSNGQQLNLIIVVNSALCEAIIIVNTRLLLRLSLRWRQKVAGLGWGRSWDLVVAVVIPWSATLEESAWPCCMIVIRVITLPP